MEVEACGGKGMWSDDGGVRGLWSCAPPALQGWVWVGVVKSPLGNAIMVLLWCHGGPIWRGCLLDTVRVFSSHVWILWR